MQEQVRIDDINLGRIYIFLNSTGLLKKEFLLRNARRFMSKEVKQGAYTFLAIIIFSMYTCVISLLIDNKCGNPVLRQDTFIYNFKVYEK